jgi:DNA-binding transcriptional LysR family regulator
MALALVAAGLGVTLVPHGSSSFCRDEIVYRPLERGPKLELGVMYRRDTLSELLAQFLALARDGGRRRTVRHAAETARR